ncbi:CHASE domain-containing protein [Neotabrizicola sp. VNH66]|uniref:CHASE domain-containing protein n=1 Tax=Neotabrizicola sp. VNH66 TaxID=3400918 RepID=UPI003C0E095E
MFRKPLVALVAFGCSALLGSAVTWSVHLSERARAEAEFRQHLDAAAASLGRQLAQDMAYLTATRAFLTTQTGVPERAPFAAFVAGLGLSAPMDGLMGVGFAQILLPEDEPATAARLRRHYGTDRGIWPEPAGNLRSVIVLLEPSDPRNSAALGYDMATEPHRRAAMETAMETGEPAATAPVTLVQEITAEKQAGFLIYLYLPEERAAAVPAGFVYSPIRAGELFNTALSRVGMAYDLMAVDIEAPDVPLFRTDGFQTGRSLRHLSVDTEVRFAGRRWLLTAQSREGDGYLQLYPFTLLAAAAMALLSVSIGLSVQFLTAAVRKERSLNAAQDRLVREKDLHLREMSHRLKNALARVVAMTRQAARGAETKEEFVASVTRRLQSMANAQDMLTRASGQIALRALLASELRQILGEDAALPAMTGPEVQLTAHETRALGLTFHELATNALKYGAGAVEGGQLSISWTVDSGARPQLHLIWDEETGTAAAAPERKGFGSQLIDSCIRGELGGTVARRYHASGLTVELHVPLGQTAEPAALPG